jgi:ankyrin repeat protein
MLLEAGADPNAINKDRETPLFGAVKKSRKSKYLHIYFVVLILA